MLRIQTEKAKYILVIGGGFLLLILALLTSTQSTPNYIDEYIAKSNVFTKQGSSYTVLNKAEQGQDGSVAQTDQSLIQSYNLPPAQKESGTSNQGGLEAEVLQASTGPGCDGNLTCVENGNTFFPWENELGVFRIDGGQTRDKLGQIQKTKICLPGSKFETVMQLSFTMVPFPKLLMGQAQGYGGKSTDPSQDESLGLSKLPKVFSSDPDVYRRYQAMPFLYGTAGAESTHTLTNSVLASLGSQVPNEDPVPASDTRPNDGRPTTEWSIVWRDSLDRTSKTCPPKQVIGSDKPKGSIQEAEVYQIDKKKERSRTGMADMVSQAGQLTKTAPNQDGSNVPVGVKYIEDQSDFLQSIYFNAWYAPGNVPGYKKTLEKMDFLSNITHTPVPESHPRHYKAPWISATCGCQNGFRVKCRMGTVLLSYSGPYGDSADHANTVHSTNLVLTNSAKYAADLQHIDLAKLNLIELLAAENDPNHELYSYVQCLKNGDCFYPRLMLFVPLTAKYLLYYDKLGGACGSKEGTVHLIGLMELPLNNTAYQTLIGMAPGEAKQKLVEQGENVFNNSVMKSFYKHVGWIPLNPKIEVSTDKEGKQTGILSVPELTDLRLKDRW